jgi:hypothetical protein
MNRHYFQAFYDIAFMPSLFAKPRSYAVERERRMIFERREDLRSPTIIVNDPECLKYIHLVDGR